MEKVEELNVLGNLEEEEIGKRFLLIQSKREGKSVYTIERILFLYREWEVSLLYPQHTTRASTKHIHVTDSSPISENMHKTCFPVSINRIVIFMVTDMLPNLTFLSHSIRFKQKCPLEGSNKYNDLDRP